MNVKGTRGIGIGVPGVGAVNKQPRAWRRSAEPDEEVTAVHALTHPDVKGSFIIGTMRNQIGEYEPSQGRLILFTFGDSRELSKVAEAEAGGCVYALASVGSHVAVAVNTSVCLVTLIHPSH